MLEEEEILWQVKGRALVDFDSLPNIDSKALEIPSLRMASSSLSGIKLPDIWPISLVESLYKLLAKVLANWLKKALSRLKINLEKRKPIPIKDVSNLEDLVWVLGYKVDAFPTTYLRLPLGAPYKPSKV
ncbi:hypothetical protein AAG906_020604 [Vitis piasezkii]